MQNNTRFPAPAENLNRESANTSQPPINPDNNPEGLRKQQEQNEDPAEKQRRENPPLPKEKQATNPTIAGLSPALGSARGGQNLTIKGSGFTGATAVHVGDTEIAEDGFKVVDDETITLRMPAFEGNETEISVVGPNGRSESTGETVYKAS